MALPNRMAAVLAAACLSFGLSPRAHADKTGIESPQARARYKMGVGLFKKGQFADAAREFKVALALEPGSAKLAYNLARSLESAGDLAPAVEAYRTYLKLAPDASDRADVEKVVVALESMADKPEPAAEPPPEPAAPAPAKAPPPAAAPAPAPTPVEPTSEEKADAGFFNRSRTIGFSMLGTGLIVALLGSIHGAGLDPNKSIGQSSDGSVKACDVAGELYQCDANAGSGAKLSGVLLMAAGGVVAWLQPFSDSSVELSVLPGPGEVGLAGRVAWP